MEVDAVCRKRMKVKGKIRMSMEGGKEGKESHTRVEVKKPQINLLYFERECRNCGKYGHKAADCWHKYPKPRVATVAVSSLVFLDLYPLLRPCQS